VIGGESYLVDAWHVAEQMRSQHPREFAALARIPATFQKIHLQRYNLVPCFQFYFLRIIHYHGNVSECIIMMCAKSEKSLIDSSFISVSLISFSKWKSEDSSSISSNYNLKMDNELFTE